MALDTFIGSIIGFVPAIYFMFHSLKKYEHFLNDRKMFLSFGGGFFVAIIAGFFEMVGIFSLDYTNYLDGGDISESTAIGFSIVSIFGIAIVHEAVKTMVLNHPKFLGKKDTLYYGASLGFGFAAMYVFLIVIWGLTQEKLETIDFVYAIILLVGITLLHGSLGVIIGYGCSNFKTKKYFVIATFLHVILNFVLFLRGWEVINKPISAFFVLAYGSLLYLYIYYNVLPTALTEEQKKERRRVLRQRSRK